MLLNLLLAWLLLNPIGNVYSKSDHYFEIAKNEEVAVPKKIESDNLGAIVSAKRYAAIDLHSGLILAQKDGNVRQPMASITKLMTALVILDAKPNWQKIVEMKEIDETVGAFPHIYRGEQVKFFDLFKCALISSDNNSIMAMVRSLGLSREEFVARMNEKAEALKMYNTSFDDPTGLSPKNLSTAIDLAKLIYEALKKNEIKETVLQTQYSFDILNQKKERHVSNTDILIKSFLNDPKCGYELIGGKTGFLPESGYCLGVQISKDKKGIVVVVLNSDSLENRFQDSKVLVDWVYENYKWEK